jgi:peptide/nickel transport system substrate-binding protein
VTLELRVQEYPAYLEAAQQDSLELYMTSWGTVTLDADYTLYAFFHSSEIPQNNLSRFDNPEVDGWLDEGRATPDDAVREEAYTEVQQTVLEDVPMVTLYYPYSTYVKGNRLQGEEVPFSFINLDLRHATLSE